MKLPRAFTPDFLERLRVIHARTDERAAALAAALGPALVCKRGCCDCCQDELTVLEIEAAWILAHREHWTGAAAGPHPAGACAFLDTEGGCRIYPWRPFVCRTQGLPLRWLDAEGEAEAGRDICPLNAAEMADRGLALGDVPADGCWTLGETEGRLASLQAEASGEFKQVRIRLRNLFGAGGTTPVTPPGDCAG